MVSETTFPDYMTDPDAVLKDDVKWRHGRTPDYARTRKAYVDTKSQSHPAGSLESMVENLVKNWEIEASYKEQLSDWRTVDHTTYTFSVNGGPPQDAEHMLKVGTYSAIITPNEFYSPEFSTFESSHKTFKRMMPTFAWEVLEVYSPPPVVAFKWRHWGTMKQDYVGWNNKGEKVQIKAHGNLLDIQGITVAKLNENFQVTTLEVWMDPVDMFNKMKPNENTLSAEIGEGKSATVGDHAPSGSTPAQQHPEVPSGVSSAECPFLNKVDSSVA